MQSNSEAVPQRAGSIRTGFARYSRQLISDPVRAAPERGGGAHAPSWAPCSGTGTTVLMYILLPA